MCYCKTVSNTNTVLILSLYNLNILCKLNLMKHTAGIKFGLILFICDPNPLTTISNKYGLKWGLIFEITCHLKKRLLNLCLLLCTYYLGRWNMNTTWTETFTFASWAHHTDEKEKGFGKGLSGSLDVCIFLLLSTDCTITGNEARLQDMKNEPIH